MGNTETVFTLSVYHADDTVFAGHAVSETEEYPSFEAAMADLEDYERSERVGFDFDTERDDNGRTGNLYRGGACVGYWSILRTA